jgi:hypothetical protein
MLAQRFVQPTNGIKGRNPTRSERSSLLEALHALRDEMDLLELWEAGAHLSQAIAALERYKDDLI